MSERPDYPTDRDILDARFELAALETWNAYPGRIQNYDPDTQTADVVPLLRIQVPQSDGSYIYEEAPPAVCVPIIQPRTRGWFLALPVQDGDTVMCVVCDGDVSTWHHGSGDLTSPRDLRRHHMSHTVAFVGLYPFNQPLVHRPPGPATPPEPTNDAMVFGSDASDGTRVSFKLNGALEITRGATVALRLDPDGTVHVGGAAGQFVALAALVQTQLTALKTAITAAPVTPGDGGATFKAALLLALASWPGDVAATKAKAT